MKTTILRTEVGATMITNVKRGHAAPPEGDPWEACLFVQDIVARKGKERREPHRRRVEVIRGDTEEQMHARIAAFVERPGVLLLETELPR